jgi:hypothetical protein
MRCFRRLESAVIRLVRRRLGRTRESSELPNSLANAKDFDLGFGAARKLEVPMSVAATTYQAIQTAIGHGYSPDFAAFHEVAARAVALLRKDTA